jgi:Lrp/AsnC family transcriptional regulator, leucine-responsive regulatory protein
MPYEHLDRINCQILEHLQANGRISFSELARRVGLSTPSVIERIRKLEDVGILAGFTARVNLGALGYSVMALIEVKTNPSSHQKVLEFARQEAQVRECYFVTGDSSIVARVVMRDIAELQGFVERLGMFGATRTSVVLSQPMIKDSFVPSAAP